MKNAVINIRIEPKIKEKAEVILHRVGLSNAEAIRLFYNQICLRKGLPFEIKIPNKETIIALNDSKTRKTHKAKSVDSFFDDLG